MTNSSKKRRVLFVCYANMIRSQMAEGFARKMAGAFLDIYSAGIHPTGLVSPEAAIVMKEKDVDISGQTSKGLRDVPVKDMDYVVNMSGYPTEIVCPPDFEGVTIDWRIEDPVGKSVDYYRAARDTIEERMKALVEQLWKGNPAA